jgi:phosphoglucomutase
MNTTTQLLEQATAKAASWLTNAVDETTQAEVKALMKGDEKNLLEAFYSDLEFGTGGLRGIMGVGSMRMNKYTVGMATQGLANYILKQFDTQPCAVAIAYDSRNNSRFFADTAAAVLSANGISVHIFDALRPTPLLSFAVRELKCKAGIVITASHNPKEYNGYKVYWEDGAQVLPPNDKGIINEVRSVLHIEDVKFEANKNLIHSIGEQVEQAYFKNLESIIHAKDEIKKANDLKIVYTSIHGTGITMVPKALHALGFSNVLVVKEQEIPDGNFTTVVSPNPEEREALSLALELAEKENADLVLATDPDADRVGLAVRNNEGKLVLLNGNQAACLLVYYELQRWSQKQMLNGTQYIAKTIVTTDLLEEIAKAYNVKWYDTLTGFKYIAGVIREREGKETFIAGGEESYGYSVGEFVRDKDAILSSVVIAEIAAWCRANNTTLWNMLMEIYERFGLYHEALVSITMKGLDGLEKINSMMVNLRATPPKALGASDAVELRDIQHSTITNLASGAITKIDLPASNVLQFVLADGSKISARPSGTEPKIKFYFSLKEKFAGKEKYASQVEILDERIKAIQKELGLL